MSTLSYSLGLDPKDFIDGIKDAQQAMNGLKSATGGMDFPFVNKLAAGLDVAKAAFQAASEAAGFFKEQLDQASGAAAAIEDAAVALRVFTGDAKEAAKAAAQVAKFAATPPFDMKQTQEAARLLLSTGTEVNNLTTELTILGNIAAAGNIPIEELGRKLAKSSEQGYVSFMELRTMLSSGIPIIEMLSEALGGPRERIREMAEEGSISVANLKEAFNRLGGEGGKFAKILDEIIQTTNGMKLTLSGAIGEIYETLGAPVNDLLRPMLQESINFAHELRDEMGIVVQMVKEAKEANELGQLIEDGIAVGVGEGINYIAGMFDYAANLAKIFFTGSAEQIDAVFGLGTTEVFKNAFENAGELVNWLGSLVLTELSTAFLNVAKTFHAALSIGMDWVIRKLMDALELVYIGDGGGEAMSWDYAMHNAGKIFDGIVKDNNAMQKVALNGIKNTAVDCLTTVKDVVETIGSAIDNVSHDMEFKKRDIFDTSEAFGRLEGRYKQAFLEKSKQEKENEGKKYNKFQRGSNKAQPPALKQGEKLYTKGMQMRDQMSINRAVGNSTFTKAARLGTESEMKQLIDKWRDAGKDFGEANAYAAEDMKQNAKAQLAMQRPGNPERMARLQNQELRKQAAGITPAQKEALKNSREYQGGTEIDKYNARQEKKRETREKRNNQKPEKNPKDTVLDKIAAAVEKINESFDVIKQKFELA